MRLVYAVLFTTLSLPVYAQDIITLGCKRLTGDVPAYNEFSLDLDHLYVIDNIFEDVKILTEVKDAAITYLILKRYQSEKQVLSRKDWIATIAVCDKTVRDFDEPYLSPTHLETWCAGEWSPSATMQCAVKN